MTGTPPSQPAAQPPTEHGSDDGSKASPGHTPEQAGRRWQRQQVGKALICVALLGAIIIFLAVVNFHYPVRTWLVWRYLWVSAVAVVWALSCLSAGLFILDRLRMVRADDVGFALPLAFPLGVLAFQLAMFVVGLAGLLGTAAFVVLPALFLLSGFRRLATAARALRSMAPPRTFGELGLVVLGIAGVVLLYVQILSPEPFHWDSRWYHLPIAQQYAISGAVRPWPEGWWLSAYPHSTSLVYAWAFLLPGSILFDRLELCVHLELVVFIATIASIPAMVRQLAATPATAGAPAAPAAWGRSSWAAIFLFPGIFLYDGNLNCGADHFAALWCAPIMLTLMRVWRKWEVREAGLFAAFVGAAMITKYSAWSMLLFPGLLFLGRGVHLGVRRLFKRGGFQGPVLPALGAAAAVLVAVSATHWLRNWIWYGDPLYPVLYQQLRVKPWSPETAASLNIFKTFVFAPRPGWTGVWEALKTTFTFSFEPNNWPVFHRNVPIFGSMFTLSMLLLPMLGVRLRLWLAYLGVMAAIVIWYLSNHQDRYLQAWLPVMVACSVASFGLVWQQRHLMARTLIVLLAGLQALWGADVPFFPTHNLTRDSAFRIHATFAASGFLRTPHRLRVYGDYGEVGENLPRGATLLVHETNMQIGFNVRVVNDQWQSLISYVTLGSPAAIHRQLSALKVTHVLWERAQFSPWNSVGSDLAFLDFALNRTEDKRVIGQFTLARLPAAPPAGAFNDRVAYVGCGSSYRSGFYRLGQLTVPDPGKPWTAPEAPLPDLGTALRDVGFLVVEPACAPALPPEAGALFHAPMPRPGLQLYARRI